MELMNKIVVVTGGASGIGRALCRRFKAAGAQAVVVVDMNAAGAETVAAEIGGVAMTADVSKESDVLPVINQTERDIGPIDLFCSNAGIARSGGVETPDKAWQKSWEVNVMAHIYAARTLVPRMVERGGRVFAEYRLGGRFTESDWFRVLRSDQTRRDWLWRVAGDYPRPPGPQSLCPVSTSSSDCHADRQ